MILRPGYSYALCDGCGGIYVVPTDAFESAALAALHDADDADGWLCAHCLTTGWAGLDP